MSREKGGWGTRTKRGEKSHKWTGETEGGLLDKNQAAACVVAKGEIFFCAGEAEAYGGGRDRVGGGGYRHPVRGVPTCAPPPTLAEAVVAHIPAGKEGEGERKKGKVEFSPAVRGKSVLL